METLVLEPEQSTTTLIEPCFDEETATETEPAIDPEQEAFDAACADAIAWGGRIREHKDEEESFAAWFREHAHYLAVLRLHFPPRGSHAKRTVNVNGKGAVAHTWASFVDDEMGVSSQYVNRLLRKYEQRDGDVEPKATTATVDVADDASED